MPFVKFPCVDNSCMKQHTLKINVSVKICVEADADAI